MPTRFDDFMAEVEEEARAAGPLAVAQLEAFRLHFTLARQLVECRRDQHLTQQELAERSGVGQAEISRIERGQSNPTVSTLAGLTRALGVSIRLVDTSSMAGVQTIDPEVLRADLDAYADQDPTPRA